MNTFLLKKARFLRLVLPCLMFVLLLPFTTWGQTCTSLTATDDLPTTEEETPILINVLLNDCDPDGSVDSTTLTVYSFPQNGVLSVIPDPPYSLYEPSVNFCGMDSFAYFICDSSQTVCDTAFVFIDVTCVNDAPVAEDDFFITVSGSSEIFGVLQNDSDVDDQLSACEITIIKGPENGLTFQGTAPDCNFIYSPFSSFCGADSLIYEICDASVACDTANVYFDVTCVNTPPTAINDYLFVDPATPIVMDVLSNDSDLEDSLADCDVNFILPPSNGMLIPTGSPYCDMIYFPNSYCGNDLMIYTIEDAQGLLDTATVFVNMTCMNNAPNAINDFFPIIGNTITSIDLAANDTDAEDGNLDPCTINILQAPNNGTLTIDAACIVEYTPATGFCGDDNFIYEICDSGGSCDQAAASLEVCFTPRYTLDAKVYLAGVFDQNLMRDDLRQLGYLPVEEPYSALGYDRGPSAGGEVCNPAIFQITGSTAIVDWLLIEFRDGLDPSTLLGTKAVLLQRDGKLIEPDGRFPVEIDLEGMNEDVIIAIRHRNHLSTISSICSSPCNLDFLGINSPGQIQLSNGRYALQAGSADGDDLVNAADRSEAWNRRNVMGYDIADLNLDGVVNATDRSIAWNNRNGMVNLP